MELNLNPYFDADAFYTPSSELLTHSLPLWFHYYNIFRFSKYVPFRAHIVVL
jgi:hypothetical protein